MTIKAQSKTPNSRMALPVGGARACLYSAKASVAQGGAQKAAQNAALAEAANANGWNAVVSYADEGVSGLSAKPGLMEMIDAAKRGDFDVVVMPDITCISRDPALRLTHVAALHSAGVVIWTLRDGLVDLTSLTFLEQLVTQQRTTANDFRERWRRGRADAARRREIAAGSTNPELPGKDRLAAMEWRIAHHRDPVGRYLTLASLITDLGHQGDEDGTHYAVDCALDILSQATWHQARLFVDALGNAIEFEDDIYDGWGLAAAVGEVVLLKDRSERLRAIRALVECGIEDLPFEWGRETALFLKKQRLAAVEQVNV